MPTMDWRPGIGLTDDLQFLDDGSAAPEAEGTMAYRSGAFVFKDEEGAFNPRSEVQHATLPQLIHFVDEGPGKGFTGGPYFKETLPNGSLFPTSMIWWTNSEKTQKIIEKLITWTGILPTTIVWNMYDETGTLVETATDVIAWTGVIEHTKTRTES